MKEIEPGVLAIASCNSLLRFDTRTDKMDTVFNSGNYCVRTVWQYEDNIFFGTYGGGLFIYKNGKVKALPLDKNKYLLYTHCFVKDDAGYCWISTNKGLFKTGLSALVQSFDNDTSSVYYYYFGRSDGMDMTELNGGCTPCALLKKDKTISFPSMDGLLWVNPGKCNSRFTGRRYLYRSIFGRWQTAEPRFGFFKRIARTNDRDNHQAGSIGLVQ